MRRLFTTALSLLALALARRLGIIMHAMLRDETEFVSA
jgi:hypothetical protein